jgi:predicted transcriptional regulator of viral defense system
MRAEQITLEGEAVPFPLPAPRRLTERQRALMNHVRWQGSIRTRDVGNVYRDPSGALGRLERRGLIHRVKRGHWRLAT